jgi:rubrerythrin
MSVSDRGETYCEAGDMILSVAMERDLREVFVEKVRPSVRKPSHGKWGGRWFCPGCGVEMLAQNESVQCPNCGRCLDPFLYHLIELHPHR